MNSIVKNILLVAAGATVGFFTASVMAKKEYQGLIDDLEKELNAESMKKRVEKSKEHEEAKKGNQEKKKVVDGNGSVIMEVSDKTAEKAAETYRELGREDRRDYSKTVKVYAGDKKEPIATYIDRNRENTEHPQEEDNSAPYLISLEQFSEEHPEFDKSTIYFYVGDDTLTDEDEEIMTDIAGTVGDEALDLFTIDEDGHADGDMVYVRNERLAIDYEIIGLYRSYKDTMGIVEDK